MNVLMEISMAETEHVSTDSDQGTAIIIQSKLFNKLQQRLRQN